MRKIFYGLSGVILQGYGLLTLVVIILISILGFLANYTFKTQHQIQTNQVQIKVKVGELYQILTVLESNLNYWVYQPNLCDRVKIQKIFKEEYPKIKHDINSFEISDVDTQKSLTKLIDRIDALWPAFEGIENLLIKDSDYQDSAKHIKAQNILNERIKPELLLIYQDISKIIQTNKLSYDSQVEKTNILKASYFWILILSILIIIALVTAIVYYSNRKISIPILRLKNLLNTLSKGMIREVKINDTHGEIGEMTLAAKSLVEGLKQKTQLAIEIGNKNYDSDFIPSSDDDTLGKSLLDMRESLKATAEIDKQNNWVTSGIAQVSDIIRESDAENLYRNFIKFIVSYLETNQGGIFILNDDDILDIHLELVAFFGYGKERKAVYKKVSLEDSLLGECFTEKDTVYIKKVPQNYVTITSGLGQATPSCILMVPIKNDIQTLGVLELASFTLFQTFEIEFLEKVCASLASSIASVKISRHTQKLIKELQQKSDHMNIQEETMRQNLEELYATQEEMKRQEKRLSDENASLRIEVDRLTNLLNNPN